LSREAKEFQKEKALGEQDLPKPFALHDEE
jgi:hypothetical protein